MFTKALVRRPGPNFTSGLTTSGLGEPDFNKTLAQHQNYITALENSGLQVTVLEPDDRFPDGTFVEDVAVLTDRCAVITHPGAPSRQGEEELILLDLKKHFDHLHRIQPPGTLDGGDVCQVDNLFYVGISERTNESGAIQLVSILSDVGFSSTLIDCRRIPGLLHLKTGMAYLGDGTMVLGPTLANHPAFSKYRTLLVDPGEDYAANCIRVNDTILVAAGFERFHASLKKAGLPALPLEMSEFQKMDGGLSCLSLRF